jgi:hypothetical protein
MNLPETRNRDAQDERVQIPVPASVKCISVRQPWAHLIIHGHPQLCVKDVENRVWHTSYRGPLLIHAARQVDTQAVVWFRRHGVKFDTLDFGAVIGLANLVDCLRECRMSSWHNEGLYGFYLRDPRPLPAPVPKRGLQGLFPVPVESVPGLADLLALQTVTR